MIKSAWNIWEQEEDKLKAEYHGKGYLGWSPSERARPLDKEMKGKSYYLNNSKCNKVIVRGVSDALNVLYTYDDGTMDYMGFLTFVSLAYPTLKDIENHELKQKFKDLEHAKERIIYFTKRVKDLERELK